jgi:hypothetical protein
MLLLMNNQVNQLTIYAYLIYDIQTQPKPEHRRGFMCVIRQWR